MNWSHLLSWHDPDEITHTQKNLFSGFMLGAYMSFQVLKTPNISNKQTAVRSQWLR